MKAYISITDIPSKDLSPLKIDEKNISFFIDPIKTNSEWQQSKDGKTWYLSFFNSTPFKQTLKIQFDDTPDSDNKTLAKAAYLNNWVKIEDKNKKEALDKKNKDLIPDAKEFLQRDVSLDQLKNTNDWSGLIFNNHGLAFFSSYKGTFQRIVLLLALSTAYIQVIEKFKTELSTAARKNTNQTEHINSLSELYNNVLKFNAGEYFRHPIKRHSSELFQVWEYMTQHFKLQTLNDELTLQLSAIAKLLKEEHNLKIQQDIEQRDRQQQERESKFNQRLGIVGIIFALIFGIPSWLDLIFK